jgi:hypothetical protein
MPARPKPTEMPDLPIELSVMGLPDGARGYDSIGQLFEAKNGQWIRCLPGAPESTKPLKARPEPLDAGEIAIWAARPTIRQRERINELWTMPLPRPIGGVPIASTRPRRHSWQRGMGMGRAGRQSPLRGKRTKKPRGGCFC